MYKAVVYIRGRAKKHHAKLTASDNPLTCTTMQALIGIDKGKPLPNFLLDGVDEDNQPDFRWTSNMGIKVIKGSQENVG